MRASEREEREEREERQEGAEREEREERQEGTEREEREECGVSEGWRRVRWCTGASAGWAWWCGVFGCEADRGDGDVFSVDPPEG